MPSFPIIDTHLHIWDHARTQIGWAKGNPLFERNYTIEDFSKDCGRVEVEAIVFMEAHVDTGYFAEEVAFVTENAKRDSRIKSIVCKAPVEDGRKVLDFLRPLKERYPLVNGVRRLIEFDPDPEICVRPSFIEGVRALGEIGFTFDVNIHHTQFEVATRFMRAVDNVPLMLDHCGKPGIREGELAAFRRHIKEVAKLPNVWCKISDLPAAAHHRKWTREDLRPYVDAVVEAFGFDRIVYAGDYPVLLVATDIPSWVATMDALLEGASTDELRKYYRDNAVDFYRLKL